jgi:hypothetical protein
MDPQLLGIALIVIAVGAFVIRLATRGQPDLQLVGLIATLVLVGLVVVLFAVFVRSALSQLV